MVPWLFSRDNALQYSADSKRETWLIEFERPMRGKIQPFTEVKLVQVVNLIQQRFVPRSFAQGQTTRVPNGSSFNEQGRRPEGEGQGYVCSQSDAPQAYPPLESSPTKRLGLVWRRFLRLHERRQHMCMLYSLF